MLYGDDAENPMLTFLMTSLFFAPTAEAFCGAYAGSAGSDIYNSVSEVAIARQHGRTTLSVSNDVDGVMGDTFALLIPVPEILTEDDVHVLDRSVFDTLDAYTRPRMVTYTCDDFTPIYNDPCAMELEPKRNIAMATEYDASGDSGDADHNVDVEAEFIVGEYEIVILSAEDSDDLFGWLTDEGFQVSRATEEVVQEYLDSGSYFFAAKVHADAGIGDGDVLSPLQFSYDSEVFSLPIRIGTAASKGVQDLVVYAITDYADGSVGISNYPSISFEDECMLGEDFTDEFGSDLGAYYQNAFTQGYEAEPGADWMFEYGWGNGHCDPCTGEQPDEKLLATAGFDFEQMDYGYYVSRLHMRYTPDEAVEDVVMYTSGLTEQEQVRFIEPDAKLHWKFDVCGIGKMPGASMADCNYDPDPYSDICEDDGCGCAATRRAPQVGGLAIGLLMFVGLARRRKGQESDRD